MQLGVFAEVSRVADLLADDPLVVEESQLDQQPLLFDGEGSADHDRLGLLSDLLHDGDDRVDRQLILSEVSAERTELRRDS